jgi:ribonuclease E
MREDGERDAFTWVRGRTPSLEDPYVWFDPINPAPRAERAPVEVSEARDVEALANERPEGERAEREGGRSRRRRGRGRGRDRGGLPHEAKVEDRAVNEGLPPVGSPDTPIATVIPTEEAAVDAPEIVAEAAEAPKRRRVRRKVSADVAAEAVIEAPAEAEAEVVAEAEPVVVPAQLDVEPVFAAKVEAAIEQALSPEPAPQPAAEPTPAPITVVEPTLAPTPEVDVAAMIAEDPNQIVAPPEKPKRGWWRR